MQSTNTEDQIILLQRLKYYETAYMSSIKLVRAATPGSEAQIHLFSASKYYQDKITQIKKELAL
jgi:hypothetical protein